MTGTLEIYEWEHEGYKPLLFSQGWQVALLNWEPLLVRENVSEIERHNESDEAFILLNGQAVIFTQILGFGLKAVEMEYNKIYNVPRGIWHNLVATQDVTFLIVENRDTHINDTEIRAISSTELEMLDAQLPTWAI